MPIATISPIAITARPRGRNSTPCDHRPMRLAPWWTVAAPIAGWLLLAGTWMGWGGAYLLAVAIGLAGCIVAAVYHAEVVAHRVGEPFGTFLLAIAITVIEVGLILTIVIAGGEPARSIARDTVFAAAMIAVNG